MSTTIPDGIDAARARNARDTVTGRLHVTGDEARYMLGYLRYRLGVRATRPGPKHYLGAWSLRRLLALEAEVDAYITLAQVGQDEEVDVA